MIPDNVPGVRSLAQQVGRTANAAAPFVQHVRVDHRGLNVRVPEQFLDSPDVVSGHQQMCGKRVPKGVASDALRHASLTHGLQDRASGCSQLLQATWATPRISQRRLRR